MGLGAWETDYRKNFTESFKMLYLCTVLEFTEEARMSKKTHGVGRSDHLYFMGEDTEAMPT